MKIKFISLIFFILSCVNKESSQIVYAKFGIINQNGDVVLDFKYNQIEKAPIIFGDTYKYNLYRVLENDKYGFINKKFQLVIKPIYDEAEPFFIDGISQVRLNKRTFYIDTNGVETKYKYYKRQENKSKNEKKLNFKEGLAIITKNGKKGYINEKNEIVIKPKYYLAYPFSDGVAVVYVSTENHSSRQFYINKKGKTITNVEFRYISLFRDSLGIVQLMNRDYGFIDINGNITSKPEFDHLRDFINGLSPVQIKGKYGFINKKGDVVIEPKFDSVFWFVNGFAIVVYKGKYGTINKKGEFIIEPKYDYLENFGKNLYKAQIGSENKQFKKYNDIVKFEGSYNKNRQRTGRWVIVYKYNQTHEGYYKNGVKNGEWKIYDKRDGTVGEINYTNGKAEGLSKQFNRAGKLIATGNFKNGKKNGLWKSYYHNGKLASIGKYYYGRKTGIWKSFRRNGELESVGKYYKGLETGKWKYYNFGKVSLEGFYKNGRKDGKWINTYNPNRVEIYKNGYKDEPTVYLKYKKKASKSK